MVFIDSIGQNQIENRIFVDKPMENFPDLQYQLYCQFFWYIYYYKEWNNSYLNGLLLQKILKLNLEKIMA